MTDPKIITILRISYGASQILSILVLLFLRMKINKANQKNQFVEVEEPAKPFSDEYNIPQLQVNLDYYFRQPTKKKMSVLEYDLAEVGKQMQQTLVSAGILVAIHSYFGYVQPLFLQSILPWKNLLTLPVVRVHLFGAKPVDDLARPWKAPNPFGDLVDSGKTEAAAEETPAVEDKKESPKKGKKAKKED